MFKITRWRPDTCGCEIEYSWDDSVPLEQRVHTAHSVSKLCPFHKGLDKVEAHNILTSENQGKNRAIGHILDNYPECRKQVLDANGDVAGYDFKSKDECKWSFDDNRVLVLEVQSLDVNKKASLKTTIEDIVGKNKVEII